MTQETVQDMIISLKKLIETSSEFLALDDKVNPGKRIPFFLLLLFFPFDCYNVILYNYFLLLIIVEINSLQLVHPYGKLNIDEQKILFNKHVQSIKSILQQYKRWIATEKDLNKYLSSLKVTHYY